MDEENRNENSTVDLTEDEDSSEANVGKDESVLVGDSSNNFNISIPQQTCENSVVASPIKPISPKVKPTCTIVQAGLSKKVGQFTSVQIKPPKHAAPKSPDVDKRPLLKSVDVVATPCNSKTDAANCLQLHGEPSEARKPENSVTCSQKKPPGKVVIIKKNNKYYKIIIPHNVMPNINQSAGPVLINIPEVGPLVISNDPQSTKAAPSPVVQQLSLNLDAVKPKLDCEVDSKVSYLEDEFLKDKKFCWTVGARRKRDLDGFTATDRLGFSRPEVKRAKKCTIHLKKVLAKYEKRLCCFTNEYKTFKMSLLKQENVKLVKINSIIERGRRNREMKDEKDTELCIKSNSEDEPPLYEYGSDLLVTKKIVMLDKNNKEVRRKRTSVVSTENIVNAKRKRGPTKSNQPKKGKQFNITPCYVQIVKDDQVEEAYRRLCEDLDAQKEKKGLDDAYVKLNESLNLSVEEIKEAEDTAMLVSRIIRTDEFLEKEMNIHKPILIVTEQTVGTERTLEYYCNEFSKNNIVYVVNTNRAFPDVMLKSEGFVSAVEIGYIKLIDKNVFSKFVRNDMRAYGSEDTGH